MTRRRFLWAGLGVLLVLGIGATLFLTPLRWQVMGRLRGEAFNKGQPTSWWTGGIQVSLGAPSVSTASEPIWQRLMAWYGASVPLPTTTPLLELLDDDPEVIPVLCELLNSGDPLVSDVAATGLYRLALNEYNSQAASRPALGALPQCRRVADSDLRQRITELLELIDDEAR